MYNFILINIIYFTILFHQVIMVSAQETNESNNTASWLNQDHRFILIIVIGLFMLSLTVWYVVHSIKKMRKRLKEENEAQFAVICKLGDGERGIEQTLPKAY
ncbi:hypothetical protein BJ944DRAFT_262224 [Cunninghamella echinulata]|nr:hypothetical protein BJ944DRAFT_262224 [Cunninghamella echinulata]